MVLHAHVQVSEDRSLSSHPTQSSSSRTPRKMTRGSMKTTFARRTDKMPASPKVRNGQIEPYLLSGQHFNQHTKRTH